MALELIRRKWGTDVLDIHAGGVDLIFPHHEDEIAQSCAYTGRELFARFWLHGEFLDIEGTKMSKRFGNILTARDLREDRIDAGALRLLMFGTHYRKKLDWSDDALAAAREGSRRLGEFQKRLGERKAATDSPRLLRAASQLSQAFSQAMDEDLNAPRAVAALFAFMNEANAAMDAGDRPGPEVLNAWDQTEGVLAIASEITSVKIAGAANPVGAQSPGEAAGSLPETPPADSPAAAQEWATGWAIRRKQAKSSRNYVEADRIRGLLKTAGWEVRDRQDGSVEVVLLERELTNPHLET
jgi:cysteinyl-tRNA synthetase